MLALPTFAVDDPTPKPQLDTITVETAKDRKALQRQINAFVTGIAVVPRDQSLANWQTQTPICLLVAGLPREDGEYMLARLSKIAASAGAPLAPEHCKPNFYVVVTSQADALLKAWGRRDTRMFGGADGISIHKFLKATAPVRAWYNAELYNSDGTPLGNGEGQSDFDISQVPIQLMATATRIRFNDVRNLSSVMVIIDAPHAKGITFGQLAAYVAMVGLAEIRVDARTSAAPSSILQLFSGPATPPPGLSAWDEAFLKALYHTEHLDQRQISAIKTEMVQDIAPKR
ncbi:MAG: hypothetical protein M3N91_16805 [Pseudomonadota bacterium]|nr:hypothetical protein [Pseudomonadota bacterium]